MPLPESLTVNLVLRYILFHDTLLVYLGNGCWSGRNPGAINHAPTYTQAELPRAITLAVDATGGVLSGYDIRPREVWPDMPGPDGKVTLCSIQSLKNSAIPTWEPAKE